MSQAQDSCTAQALSFINSVQSLVTRTEEVIVDGNALDIPSVIAVSRYNVVPKLSRDEHVQAKVEQAAGIIQHSISSGGPLYGVTTGVGASAYTRTQDVDRLQRALVAKNLNGILPTPARFFNGTAQDHMNLVLSEPFMKGTIMVRLNTLIRGQSGVRWSVIEALYALLEHNVVPCAAKNNTVSASGDLGTLAYIAGTLLGLGDLYAWHGIGVDRKIQPVAVALKDIGLKPITYGPKEAIAILNGTAASASSAAQVLYDALVMFLAAQCLSVLAIDALRANLEPFEPFPHTHSRPHPGQIDVAANIKRMARNSKMCFEVYPNGDPEFLLRQDRYHIRCVPQWLGPLGESLVHAARELSIELNSTTDNPIINPDGTFPQNIYHAGNFMALSPAESMDKVRHAMLGIGKVLFAQHNEIVNPLLNRGLPPDCAAGEPNIDFGLKSSDLACAAYLSELGFISGSFLPFVNSTEHHNQSINSMALASARYAKESVELLQQLVATHLFTVCQAVDLREMNARYLTKLQELVNTSLQFLLTSLDSHVFDKVKSDIWTRIRVEFGRTSAMISEERFTAIFSSLVGHLHSVLESPAHAGLDKISPTPTEWARQVSVQAKELFLMERLVYCTSGGSALNSLSAGNKVVYGFVRDVLKVPMNGALPGMDTHEIGTKISTIFEAIQSGRMDSVFRDAVSA